VFTTVAIQAELVTTQSSRLLCKHNQLLTLAGN